MNLKIDKKIMVWKHCLFSLIFTLVMQANIAWSTEANSAGVVNETLNLMGEWCYEKKRYVTVYNVKQGNLQIRSGRSGRTYDADLKCNDSYTECEAQTIRGWGSLVTETLRLDGNGMNLTRSWGGAWKGKTYNFKYKRCPKWR